MDFKISDDELFSVTNALARVTEKFPEGAPNRTIRNHLRSVPRVSKITPVRLRDTLLLLERMGCARRTGRTKATKWVLT